MGKTKVLGGKNVLLVFHQPQIPHHINDALAASAFIKKFWRCWFNEHIFTLLIRTWPNTSISILSSGPYHSQYSHLSSYQTFSVFHQRKKTWFGVSFCKDNMDMFHQLDVVHSLSLKQFSTTTYASSEVSVAQHRLKFLSDIRPYMRAISSWHFEAT